MKRKTRTDGIRTLADLKAHCRIDEGGCWIWAGATEKGTPRVWLPRQERVMSMSYAVAFIATGSPPAAGAHWIPTCGHKDCANPAHRRIGTRSELYAALHPRIPSERRARIGAARRAASDVYTPEVAAAIRSSDEPSPALAARFGITVSHVCRIRRGQAWRERAAGASVFDWAPA